MIIYDLEKMNITDILKDIFHYTYSYEMKQKNSFLGFLFLHQNGNRNPNPLKYAKKTF
jgi:hypothetical protein